MSLALATRPRLRFSGRSFLAFVIEPTPPLSQWLADLDDVARQSVGFFTDRPVIVDLSKLAPDRRETKAVIDALRTRAIRIIAVEGVDPSWLDRSMAPLARGVDSAKAIDPAEKPVERQKADTKASARIGPPPPAISKVIERPIRSGQSIFHGDGDLTILGSVSSGAEVVAAGSIHIYGALRGRALAGALGSPEARIFCRKFEAELVAINGCYLTAENSPSDLIGKPVHIRLDGDAFEMNVSD